MLLKGGPKIFKSPTLRGLMGEIPDLTTVRMARVGAGYTFCTKYQVQGTGLNILIVDTYHFFTHSHYILFACPDAARQVVNTYCLLFSPRMTTLKIQAHSVQSQPFCVAIARYHLHFPLNYIGTKFSRYFFLIISFNLVGSSDCKFYSSASTW